MIDIHCHMLPDIDDGPRNWKQSLALARRAAEVGITTVIITPHFIPGIYRWKPDEGRALHAEFRERLTDAGVSLNTFLAAEVGLFAELPEWIQAGKVPLMPTDRHILLETPMYGGEAMLKDMAFAVLSLGITPIFAHPERSALFMDLRLARDLVETKVELQIDAGGLLGRWGPEMERLCLDLIDQGLIRYVASDAHGVKQRNPKELRLAAEVIEKRWGSRTRAELTHDNPKGLLKTTPD